MSFTQNSGFKSDSSGMSDYDASYRYETSCIYCSSLPWLCTCNAGSGKRRSPVTQAAEASIERRRVMTELVDKKLRSAALYRTQAKRRKRHRDRVEMRSRQRELDRQVRHEAAITLKKMKAGGKAKKRSTLFQEGDVLNPIDLLSSSDEEAETPPTEEYDGRPSLSDFRGNSASKKFKNRAKFSGRNIFIDDEAFEQNY